MDRIEKAILEFERNCANIARETSVPVNEHFADKEARIKRAQKDYKYFFETYLKRYAMCETADFQINAANKIKNTKDFAGIFEWARGHAKSVHMGIGIPMWLKIQPERQFNVMVLVSKNEDMADKLLSDIQAQLATNKLYIHDFGEQISYGSWAEGEFTTRDGCGFFSRGKGQSPRGLRAQEWRPDYILIDDFDDDEECRNVDRVKASLNWLKEALFGALDMGQGKFIMVGNRIHKKSALAQLAENKAYYHNVVNAINKEGKPSWPQKYTLATIERVRFISGYRAFEKEYQNNPIEEGKVFKKEDIIYGKVPKLHELDAAIVYIDPAWKDSKTSDHKAVKFWGKKGRYLYKIDEFLGQRSIKSMVEWCYDLAESWPQNFICEFKIEACFMQDDMLEDFAVEGEKRGWQLPISGDYRTKPNKFQRIEALSPFYERQIVIWNEKIKDKPDSILAEEHHIGFEIGAKIPDDSDDADEGAIHIINRGAIARQTKGIVGYKKKKIKY